MAEDNTTPEDWSDLEIFNLDSSKDDLARIRKSLQFIEVRLEEMHMQAPVDQMEHISRSMNEVNRHLTNLVAGDPLTNKSPFDKVVRAIYTVNSINIALVVLVLFLFF